MAGNINIGYPTFVAPTVTNLQSLASSQDWTAGWNCGSFDNTSNKYADYQISAQFTTHASNRQAGAINIFIIAALATTPTWTAVSSGTLGTEGAIAFTDTEERDAICVPLRSIVVDNTASAIYTFAGLGIAQLFGGAPPPIEILKLEQDGKLKVADMQVTSQQKDKDMANDRYMQEMVAKIGQQTDLAVAKINAEATIAVARIGADVQKRTKLADGVIKEQELRGKAELEVFHAANERDQTREQAQSMEGAMKGSMEDGMQRLIEAITTGNDRIVSAIEQQSEKIEGLKQTMLAPRKRIKDKSGKTIGIEIDGKTVSVQ